MILKIQQTLVSKLFHCRITKNDQEWVVEKQLARVCLGVPANYDKIVAYSRRVITVLDLRL